MTAVSERTVFADRAARASELASTAAYVAQPLALYGAIAAAQERAYLRARDDAPTAGDLVPYVVRASLPGVMEATMSAGTELLREAVLLRFHEGDLDGIVRGWLAGDALSDTDAYVARAATSPVLEALPAVAASLRGESADERTCPNCGGLPQLAVFTDTGEALVTGHRALVCSRCATTWAYPRMTCVSCRETDGAKMPILADETRFPHIRVDACDTCHSYLVSVDLRKEPRAVPLVDEIAALPLDLLAAERGYTKIARNLMGY